MTDQLACASCIFSTVAVMQFDDDSQETPTPVIECRRYPPVIVMSLEVGEPGKVGWPQVEPDEWCGEFAPVPADHAPPGHT